MSTTSLSTVRTLLSSLLVEDHEAHEPHLKSASSWLQFCMEMLAPTVATACPDVTYTALVGCQLKSSTLEGKKLLLVNWSHRKSIHLSSNLVSPDTFLRTPLPLFSSADAFKLSGMYVSLTTSILTASWSCFSMWGMNTLSAYSWKALTAEMRRQCTMTAPSRSLQS